MSPFDSTSNAMIKEYKKIRNAGMRLNEKIMETALIPDATGVTAKLLGVDTEKKEPSRKIVVLDDENEIAILKDFMIHEALTENINAVERFDASDKNKSAMERKIIKAYQSSYTSLFRIIAITREDNSVFLEDVLNPPRTNIKLIDVGFSESGHPDLLLFLRLVPFQSFHMTSGVSFLFKEKQEEILSSYEEVVKQVQVENESMKRFIAFFKINRTLGLPVIFQ